MLNILRTLDFTGFSVCIHVPRGIAEAATRAPRQLHKTPPTREKAVAMRRHYRLPRPAQKLFTRDAASGRTEVVLTPRSRGRRYHKSPNDATLQLCIPKRKLEQFFHPPLLAAGCLCFALWFCPLPTYPVVFLHPGLPDGRTCIVLQPWKRANELGQRSQIVPDLKISLSHFTSCQFWTVLS